MKSKHIDGTVGLKCDYLVWPWPWPWPWIFKIKHGICYISVRNGPIATKQKANISIELKASNVTMGFDLGHDLDLENSRSNMEFAISQSEMVLIATKQKANISIELKASNVTMGFDLGHDLDLENSRSNMEFAISQSKLSDCHETKSKHIDWTQGFKCDHGVSPWPWPWPWIFKVKYGICYISIKSDPKVRYKDLQDSDQGDFWCRHAVDSSSYMGRPAKLVG